MLQTFRAENLELLLLFAIGIWKVLDHQTGNERHEEYVGKTRGYCTLLQLRRRSNLLFELNYFLYFIHVVCLTIQ